jgi:hydrogenase maturation protein HypF
MDSPSARPTRTSSLGRLFDGVAFLLGLCDRNDTEAQAPIAVQTAAEQCPTAKTLDWAIEEGADGAAILDFRPMIRGLVDGMAKGQDVNALARAFHETLAVLFAECVRRIGERLSLETVFLTGGCFVNRLLRERLETRIRANGQEPCTHGHLSPGDGSIAFGQAVIAAARLKQGVL